MSRRHSNPTARPKKVVGESLRMANAQTRKPKLKTAPDVGTGRVMLYLRSRFNPIRMLTPELLSVYLDRFEVGYLRELSLVWDSIEKRDDKVALVRPLRMKGVARLGYQIELIDNLPDDQKAEAEKHKAALESFYANVAATSAIDENDRGGVKKLIKQMMDAVGKRYSVHEIVWQPKADGTLGAEFRWTPLWFFENTTGRLRYLPAEGLTYGQPLDLEDGGWMITASEGLMFATAIAYMFKTLPLRDWVTFTERNGMPAFLGKTNSPVNSANYNAMVQALQNIGTDFAAVVSGSETIEAVDLKGSQAALPYEPLVKRMDAAIAALWRGGDLSTMSSGSHSQGHGSNRQEDEAEIILDDDIEMINETLNQQVDKVVIEYLFGDDMPLAKFQIIRPPKEATAQDLAVDQFLIGSLPPGYGLSVEDTLKRYARNAARPKEPQMAAPAQPEQIPAGLGNERMLRGGVGDPLFRAAMRQLTIAQAAGFRPLLLELKTAVAGDDAGLKARIANIAAKIPGLLARINVDPITAKVIESGVVAEFFNGRIPNQSKA